MCRDNIKEETQERASDDTQAWFWSERWQQMEREADADFATGRYVTFDDVESFLAALDTEQDE